MSNNKPKYLTQHGKTSTVSTFVGYDMLNELAIKENWRNEIVHRS